MLERQDYLDELENWRESIKKTVREPAALFVENFVDNDPPPTNFQFMSVSAGSCLIEDATEKMILFIYCQHT